MYKCVASVEGYPNKVYLGTVDGDFKQRFYNHRMSYNNDGHDRHNTFQICLGIKEEAQDHAITEMVHNQICAGLFKYFQEMSKKLKFLIPQSE